MKKLLLLDLLVVFLLAGCVVSPGRPGSGIVVVPALPSIVELDVEPYYQHSGYFYYYQNNNWSYSNSRSGPWVELPRDRYPKEVKFKNRGDDRGQGEQRGHDGR